MKDEKQLFGGFDFLEPTAKDSEIAVRKVREAIFAVEPATPARNNNWPRIAIAALLLVVAGLVWVNLPHNDRLMAQVIRQVANAKSARIVAETFGDDSSWKLQRVTTFSQVFGFFEQHYLDGALVQTEIDDGAHHWIAPSSHKVVTRIESVEFTHLMNRLLNPLEVHKKLKREPNSDQVIDAAPHSCYRSTTDNQRFSVWLDKSRRVRRAIGEELVGGNWRPTIRVNTTYDIAVDPANFRAPSGDGIKIVETRESLSETFSLNDAVVHKQIKGYDLAVHDVKRINDVEYYVLVSLRPTDESRLKLGNRVSGVCDLIPKYRRDSGRTLATFETETSARLAVAYGAEIRILALLCNFRGVENERVQDANLRFTLQTHPALWFEVGSYNDVSLKFAIPDEETPIDDVIKSLYGLVGSLEPLVLNELHLVDDQDSRTFQDYQYVVGGYSTITRQHPRPSEISLDTFLDHIRTAKFRRNLAARSKALERREREGADDPLTFIQDLGDPDAKRPERWREKVGHAITNYWDLELQLAALRFVESEPSLIYLDEILEVLKKSDKEQVQDAAQRVMQVFKRPVEKAQVDRSWPPVEFDVDRVDELMESLEHRRQLQETVSNLRTLSGLDYGDGQSDESLKRWSRWWSEEKKSIEKAHQGNREFIVYGQVLDENDRPLKNGSVSVWLTKSIAERGVLDAAYTRTDINGRYVLRFGFRKQETFTFPGNVPVVRARVSGSQDHRFFVSRVSLHGDAILTDEPYAKIKNKPAIYPGQPFELNYRQTPRKKRP